jgi:hypothetical protein
MKRASIKSGAVAFFGLAACAAAAAEVDQIAQQKMIGLSAKRILACMGRPAEKMIIGSTQVWTYPRGSVWVEGGPFSPGVNGMASFFGADIACKVNVVLTNAAVSQINYAAADGGPLRLGEQCLFAVRDCAELSVVRARY